MLATKCSATPEQCPLHALQFSAGSIPDLFRIVRSQPLEFPESPAISPQLQDLLTRMLAKARLVGLYISTPD